MCVRMERSIKRPLGELRNYAEEAQTIKWWNTLLPLKKYSGHYLFDGDKQIFSTFNYYQVLFVKFSSCFLYMFQSLVCPRLCVYSFILAFSKRWMSWVTERRWLKVQCTGFFKLAAVFLLSWYHCIPSSQNFIATFWGFQDNWEEWFLPVTLPKLASMAEQIFEPRPPVS